MTYVPRTILGFVNTTNACVRRDRVDSDGTHGLACSQVCSNAVNDLTTCELCLLSYTFLHDAAPVYLSRRLVPTSDIPGRAKLRTASFGLLIVSYVPIKTIDSNRSFSDCAPVAWNRLRILSDGLCDPHYRYIISLTSFCPAGGLILLTQPHQHARNAWQFNRHALDKYTDEYNVMHNKQRKRV